MVQASYARGPTMQERLPIAEARNELLALIKKYPTLVLIGETGSGKTTQLPQYVLQSGLAQARPRSTMSLLLTSVTALDSAPQCLCP